MNILSVGTNEKLGSKCAAYSRPVGPSCPDSCPFLGDGCYAEHIQTRWPNVRKVWSAKAYGFTTEQWQWWIGQVSGELVEAGKKGLRAVRIHVGGDFLKEVTSLENT